MYYLLFYALHFQTWGFFWVPWSSQKEPHSVTVISLAFHTDIGSDRIGSDQHHIRNDDEDHHINKNNCSGRSNNNINNREEERDNENDDR